MGVKKYLILGGGGSFGIHAAKYLLKCENVDRVIGVGRNPLRKEAFSLNIEQHEGYDYYTFHVNYEQDLLLEFLKTEKPNVIVNFAAQGEGAVSWKRSWRFFETNTMALSKLTEELMSCDWLEHFIQIGTSEMYGSVEFAVDEAQPIKPTSPYAASKVAYDMYLESVSKFLDFPMSILRPCNCYCPGQLLHRVIPKAIWAGLTAKKLPLHGGGKAEKSYIHARDLGRAIYLLAEHGPTGEIFNVGSDNPTSIKDVVSLCAQALNMPFDDLAYVTEERMGQDSRYWLDSTKIENLLGWRPEIGWEEGLGEMVSWGQTYLDDIKDLSPEYVFRG